MDLTVKKSAKKATEKEKSIENLHSLETILKGEKNGKIQKRIWNSESEPGL